MPLSPLWAFGPVTGYLYLTPSEYKGRGLRHVSMIEFVVVTLLLIIFALTDSYLFKYLFIFPAFLDPISSSDNIEEDGRRISEYRVIKDLSGRCITLA
jgi:hypothetical protein